MSDQELQAALTDRDFDGAQDLISEWGRKVSTALQNASTDAERRQIFDEACSFAESSIFLTRVIRSHIGTELHANSASFLYQEPEAEEHGWHLRA